MKAYSRCGPVPLLDDTFLSFIRKLRKDPVNPVNPVKRVLDRIDRMNRMSLLPFRMKGSRVVQNEKGTSLDSYAMNVTRSEA
jgi:hypothetical protein